MSLLNDASLILVPSAIRTGEVLVQKPLPNKFADETGNYDGNDPQGSANLTFTRASNASRVNADGLVERVRTNLILQSNTFNTTWVNTNITLTSGQSDKDGGTNAWKISETTANSVHILLQTTSSVGMYTFSVYLKGGTKNKAMIFDGTNNLGVKFNLETKAFHSFYGTSMIYNIEELDNGWARYSITSPSASTAFRVYLLDDSYNLSYTGNTTNNIFIQNAQLEISDFGPTDYIPTTASARSTFAGITVDGTSVPNVPRLDYSGGASCPSLLLEPQRTNLALYSEQFDNAYWGKGAGVTLTANQYTSPDSYVSGDKLIGATGTDRNGDVIARIVSVSSSTTYVASIYVYKDTATQCTLYLRDGSTGTIVSTSVTLAAGWQRIECSITTGVATTQVNLYLGNTNGNIGIWGAQFEAGSYATSYIPTLGSAVSRLADTCSKTGISSLIGQTEGTLFAEVTANRTGVSQNIELGDGTAANRVDLRFTLLNTYQLVIVQGGAVVFNQVSTATFAQGETVKIAAAYKSGDSTVVYVNGVAVAGGTAGTITGSLSAIFNASIGGTLDAMNSPINQLLLFKTRLTNAQLAELTTL